MAAKMKLELFYKEGVEGVVGRKERFVCDLVLRVKLMRQEDYFGENVGGRCFYA